MSFEDHHNIVLFSVLNVQCSNSTILGMLFEHPIVESLSGHSNNTSFLTVVIFLVAKLVTELYTNNPVQDWYLHARVLSN